MASANSLSTRFLRHRQSYLYCFFRFKALRGFPPDSMEEGEQRR